MKRKKNNNYQYAMLLDKNSGVYYGVEIDQIVLIDDFGDCLIKVKHDGRLHPINLRDIFDDSYTLYLKLQLANKD